MALKSNNTCIAVAIQSVVDTFTTPTQPTDIMPISQFRWNIQGVTIANFLRAVRSRKHTDLAADIEEGHQSTALCHIANISYRLGQPTFVGEISKRLSAIQAHEDVQDTLERTKHYLTEAGVDLGKTKLTLGQYLRVDGDKESFLDNAAANALLTREYRVPFVVPKASEI